MSGHKGANRVIAKPSCWRWLRSACYRCWPWASLMLAGRPPVLSRHGGDHLRSRPSVRREPQRFRCFPDTVQDKSDADVLAVEDVAEEAALKTASSRDVSAGVQEIADEEEAARLPPRRPLASPSRRPSIGPTPRAPATTLPSAACRPAM